ncbi:MAG: leucine-rich repeat domain-containing protein [Clostridia bacterium]|nr:leucine-rich repeat domain-containing protein [Clostridia bacterium]
MDEEKKVSKGKLLYDPMFDGKPELDWTDSEKGGFFGKAIFKKTLFIIILLVSIGGSIFFSFNSLSKAKFEFEPLEDGTYKLSAFHGQKNDTVLNVDYVRNEQNVPDEGKTVSTVRKYAVSGNDTLQFIFIGKDVKEIEKTAFYYCTSLNAVFVDPENENYTSVDGILYKKENGVINQLVLCPQQHTRYMVSLGLGEKEPADSTEAAAFAKKLTDENYLETIQTVIDDENSSVGKTLEIPDTVTVIGQLSLAYCDKLVSVTLPLKLKEIETMAFFRCSSLQAIDLPDSLEIIGSDAFSKCGKIKYLYIPAGVRQIGHHAFWECNGVEKVYMAAQSLDGIETGQNWIPQYRKTIMKNRELVFGAERGVM